MTRWDAEVHERRRPWRRLGRFRRTLVVLDVLLAVGGLGGGVWMMAHPATAMPVEWLHGTRFGSWFWPGVALTVANGVLPAVVAFGACGGGASPPIGPLRVGGGVFGREPGPGGGGRP